MQSKNSLAFIKEIFVSIQGEGQFVGQSHIFIRFCQCNLDCFYCDTDYQKSKKCLVNKKAIDNPIDVANLIEIVEKLALKTGAKTIALTGGEPLCNANFLLLFLKELKRLKLTILLETNATLAQEMQKIKHLVDIVSCDLKLASVGKHANQLNNFILFVKQIANIQSYFKVVLAKDFDFLELMQFINALEQLHPKSIVFLQPEASLNFNKKNIASLIKTQSKLLRAKPLLDFRILPQLHKILKID